MPPEQTLLDDISRCHDAKCPLRENCLRWLARETGGRHTNYTATFRVPDADTCVEQLRPRPQVD